MKFEAPQIILTIILAIGLGLSLAKVEKSPEDFGITVAATTAMVALLWWGGFYG